MKETVDVSSRIHSGVAGLDAILHGGLLARRTYLVTGAPGTGKTILGLHFLAAAGDSSRKLLVSLTETEKHLKENAAAVGISTRDMAFLDLTAEPDVFSEVASYDIFSPVEVEREPIIMAIRASIEEVNPKRVFLDGLSELRMISSDMFHYLRMVQSFFRFVTDRGATLLVSTTDGITDVDLVLQAATDGVIRLASGGSYGRSLEIVKLRGGDFARGPHPMRITASGLEIFPEPV
jgi:circadian clock protein KaiC